MLDKNFYGIYNKSKNILILNEFVKLAIEINCQITLKDTTPKDVFDILLQQEFINKGYEFVINCGSMQGIFSKGKMIPFVYINDDVIDDDNAIDIFDNFGCNDDIEPIYTKAMYDDDNADLEYEKSRENND